MRAFLHDRTFPGTRIRNRASGLTSGERLIFKVREKLKIVSADELLASTGALLAEDDVNVIERRELLLDLSDNFFIFNADLLSYRENHDPSLGWPYSGRQ